jgi:hypothetical protein
VPFRLHFKNRPAVLLVVERDALYQS